jgi:hypothetical protein
MKDAAVASPSVPPSSSADVPNDAAVEDEAAPPSPAAAPPTPRARIAIVDDAKEAKRALDATFPKYIAADAKCPKNKRAEQAGTWVQLDELQVEAERRGEFKPTVVQRVIGSFTRAHADETLYRIVIEHCVANGGSDWLDVIFSTPDLYTKTPKVRVRIPESDWGPPPRWASVVTDPDEGIDVLRDDRSPDHARWHRVEMGPAPKRPRWIKSERLWWLTP